VPKIKQVLIQIRIPANLHRRLVEEAKANERSMTSHARWLLTAHLTARKIGDKTKEQTPPDREALIEKLKKEIADLRAKYEASEHERCKRSQDAYYAGQHE
jgi:hypothetical protein